MNADPILADAVLLMILTVMALAPAGLIIDQWANRRSRGR